MKLHKRIAKFFGYNLVRFKQFEAECAKSAEASAVNIINRYGIDLVLDVGANVGQYAKALRKEGYAGVIHSFEPVSADFAELSRACAADADWTAHNIALGASPTTKSINLMQGVGWHSFYELNAYGEATFPKSAVVTDTERVEVSTVDDFLSGLGGFSGKVFLKMDTQGYDLEVFAGAQGSLGKIAAIQSELSIKPIYAGVPNYIDALKTYEAAGFKPAAFYPVNADKTLTLIETDCLLINQNLGG